MSNYPHIATQARLKVLELIHRAGTSHIASNFSVIDLAIVLYATISSRDNVVWSKGWAAATIYYFLHQQGKITLDELNSFPNPPFLGLAETNVPGVLANGGSVGHGLSIACGRALGNKRAKEISTTYCIMSDGELNEGATWEAIAFAGHHKLNVVAIIDKNGWQAMGKTSDVLNYEPLAAKWKAFGWEVRDIDGHDYQAIEDALRFPRKQKPLVIIATTIKGKGVSFMENHLLYHYKHVDAETYELAKQELNA